MLKYIIQILKILTSKQRFFIIVLFIWTLLMSSIELLGLGSLVALVSVINDPVYIIDKLNSYKLNLNNFSHKELIQFLSILLIIVYTIKTFISFIFNYFSAKLTMNINQTVTSSFFKKYIYKKYEDFLKFSSTKFTNDVKDETTRFITFIFAFIHIVKDIFLVTLILLTLMVISSLVTTSIFLIILILSTFIYLILKKILRRIGSDRTKYNTKIYNILSDTFSGIKNIKLIGAENLITKNFDKHNQNLLKNTLQIRIIGPIPRIFLEWIAIFGISLLIIYLNQSSSNLSSYLPILTFIAVSSIRLIPAFAAINQNIGHLNWNLNSTILILKELKNKKKINKKNISTTIKINSIELKNIIFKYNNNQNLVLNKINLKVKKNELIGIVGANGSGKTTLVEVILGLIKPKNGFVKINDYKNIIYSKKFKNSIGYVSQDIFLFEGTILDNVTFGSDNEQFDKQLLEKTIKASDLEKFIKKHVLGVNYNVKEEGKNISGGEKQKIAIARALYRNAELIVFDEATSSLDMQTEKRVIENLNSIKSNKIIFMIAHRLTSLKYCDKIIILDNGKVFDFDKTQNILKKHKKLAKFIKMKKK